MRIESVNSRKEKLKQSSVSFIISRKKIVEISIRWNIEYYSNETPAIVWMNILLRFAMAVLIWWVISSVVTHSDGHHFRFHGRCYLTVEGMSLSGGDEVYIFPSED